MLTILLVEDNPGDARLIAELLREHSDLANEHTIVHVERVADAVQKIAEKHDIDIILSDITLPDSRGIDTLRLLNKAADQVPVIFMTGTNDEALAVTAMEQGAQDYLVKGKIDSEILSRAIRYAMQRKKFQNDMNAVIASDRMNQQQIRLLADQKQQLIKLNRSKDEFISIASHQLRTPATAVKQYVGMIVEGLVGEVNEQQRELLDRAYESNERQLRVISELLKTAQLDSSKIQLSMQPVDLNKCITECVAEVQTATDMRQQTLRLRLAGNVTIRADRDELKLAVVNVLENASKYTPHGKAITVSTDHDKVNVHIIVQDEGVGMSEEDQKVIFEKFSRVDNELSDTVQGTGLGLYWVKRIVKLHKGSIRVSSRKGQGSTFTIGLPL